MDAAGGAEGPQPKEFKLTKDEQAKSLEEFKAITAPSDSMDSALLTLQDGLRKVKTSHNKTPLNFAPMSELRSEVIPLDNIYLEYLWGCRGPRHGTLGEIVGPKNSGKTTFALWLAGKAAATGSPIYYLSCEGKPMDNNRSMRSLSLHRPTAMAMLEKITISHVYTLEEMDAHCQAWVKQVREVQHIPKAIPVVIIVDPWSKLMHDVEAAGYYEDDPAYMTSDQKKIRKDAGDATGPVHAKWASAWGRRMAWFLNHYNAVMLLVHHQNVKLDMSGGGANQKSSEMFNNTHLGGRGLEQNAAWQLILGNAETWKTSDKTRILGYQVRARMHYNSYGGRGREIRWRIRTEELLDMDDSLAPSLWFEYEGSKWLAESGLLGVTVNNGRYSCPALNIMSATPDKFWKTVNADRELINNLGRTLHITGYA